MNENWNQFAQKHFDSRKQSNRVIGVSGRVRRESYNQLSQTLYLDCRSRLGIRRVMLNIVEVIHLQIVHEVTFQL